MKNPIYVGLADGTIERPLASPSRYSRGAAADHEVQFYGSYVPDEYAWRPIASKSNPEQCHGNAKQQGQHSQAIKQPIAETTHILILLRHHGISATAWGGPSAL
jgi:hypothetical protein